MTSFLPHREWIYRRPHMAFAHDEEPGKALAGIMLASRPEAERMSLDNEHGIPLAGSLAAAGWNVARYLRTVGMDGYLWDMSIFMHLKSFVFMKGREYRMGMAHWSPWTIAHGRRMRVGDLHGIPSAGFIKFEGSRARLLTVGNGQEPRVAGVSFVITTIAGPEYDGPDVVEGDTYEEKMISLRGRPGTQDQLNLVIWPEQPGGTWPAPEPLGWMRGIDLTDPDALLIDVLAEATHAAEETQSLGRGGPGYPGRVRSKNDEDIAAMTFAALAHIRDHEGSESWQEGVPPYMLKKLDGPDAEKAGRKIRKRGFVTEVVHPSTAAPDRRDAEMLARMRTRASRWIEKLDAATTSVGVGIAEGRQSFIAGASHLAATITAGAGWLVEAAPQDRDRITTRDGADELNERHREWSKEAHVNDTRLSPGSRTRLTNAHHPILARLMATMDLRNPWSYGGAQEDEVLTLVTMIEMLLDDRDHQLPRDEMLGLMINRTLGQTVVPDPRNPRSMPTRPTEFANGLVMEGDMLIDRKTGASARMR